MRIGDDLRAFVAHSNGGMAKKISTIIANPCFHCVCLYRFSSLLYRLHLSPLSKIVWSLNRFLYHVDIDYRAKLAGGFVLIHGLGVVIGPGTVSEGRLTVYQGVTIGGNKRTDDKRTRTDSTGKVWYHPLFKDNVTVYAGGRLRSCYN